MKTRVGNSLRLLLLAASPWFASCTGSAIDAPPSADPGGSQTEHKNWLEGTGDAAWNAVSAPINGLMPKAKPKPQPVELVPTDPPEMVIITRESRGVVQEAPAPTPTAPASQP